MFHITRLMAGLAALVAMVVASSQPQPVRSRYDIQDVLSDGQAYQVPWTPNPVSGSGTGSGNSPVSAAGTTASPLASILGIVSKSSNSNTQVLSAAARDVVSGLTAAFMHKVQLQPGEKTCLKNNIGHITGDIMATGQDIVIAVKSLIKTKGVVREGNAAKLTSAGLDSALKIASLVALSTQLLQNCVRGDALEMLKRTGRHLISAKYLGHRFLVNGVDIAHGLSDSIVAFEANDFKRFGTDVGTVLRKILLSSARNGTKSLPEGVPEQVIIQKITEGVMRGFFVAGSGVIITDTADPRVNIVLNLHRCIAGNSAFFKQVWIGVWHLFAQISVNQQQHGLVPLNGTQPLPPRALKRQSQPKWAGELMIAMLQFPMALQKCGLGPSTQRMFMEAIRSLQFVKVKAKFPEDRIQALQATDRLARAVEAWTNWDYDTFGKQMGMLLRELVMFAFPRKYSVDESGRLRQQLLEDYSAQSPVMQIAALSTEPLGAKLPRGPFLARAVVGGCALSIAVGLVAVRSIWSAHRDFGDDAPFIDMEGDSSRKVMSQDTFVE